MSSAEKNLRHESDVIELHSIVAQMIAGGWVLPKPTVRLHHFPHKLIILKINGITGETMQFRFNLPPLRVFPYLGMEAPR